MKPSSVPPQKHTPADEKRLASAMNALTEIVEKLPQQYGYVLSPGKHLFYTYLKGIVYGMGALTAVAIIIPLIVSMMQRVEWVPLVGDFVKDVGTRIEQTQRK